MLRIAREDILLGRPELNLHSSDQKAPEGEVEESDYRGLFELRVVGNFIFRGPTN